MKEKSVRSPHRYYRQLPRAQQQRGAILVQFAILALVLITILGVVQIGHMYYAKRDLQRAADIAAIEAVNALNFGQPETCAQAQAAGKKSVKDQLRVGLEAPSESFDCGFWNPQKPDAQRFSARYGERGNQPLNAVKVTLQGETLQLLPFTGSRMVTAQAIAAKQAEAVAAFSVGSQLLRFNEKALLGSVLGLVGLNAKDLRLLDSDGLASIKITPSGLLALLRVDLGIGDLGLLTPNGVANIDNVTLLNILDASINAVTDATLGVELNVLRTKLLDLGLGSIKIPLGSRGNSTGLFAFIGTGRDSPLGNALDVELGLADILKTAIAIGANGRAVNIPELNVAGLITAKASIVEPPTIAIGPVGTTGYSAQIRVFLDIDTRNLLGGALNFVLETILGIRVHLPVAIDVVAAQAKLEAIQCQRMPAAIDLSIESRVLNACVGTLNPSSVMSGSHGCEVGLQEEQLIKLLHAPILSGKLHIPGISMPDTTSGLNMQVGETRSSKTNELQLGKTVDNLVTGLLNLLGGLFRNPAPALGANWNGSYTNPDITARLVETYLEATKDNAGFYNVDQVTQAVIKGYTLPAGGDPLPPLITHDFKFNNAIPSSCLLVACPHYLWSAGSFTDAFKSYTSTPGSLLDVLGISTFNNGYQSCAGLLSALLGWNSCVKHNLTKLLTDHPQQVATIEPNSKFMEDLLNPNVKDVACSGALCIILKPVLGLLKPILNGVGYLLTKVLDDVLGLQLGRTDVTALGIQCETAELVY